MFETIQGYRWNRLIKGANQKLNAEDNGLCQILKKKGAMSPPCPTPRQDLGAIGHGVETCFLGAKSHGAEVRVHKQKSNLQESIYEYFSKKRAKK